MGRSASQREVITFDLHGYGNLPNNSRGIISETVCIRTKMSDYEFPIEIFPTRIQRIISSLHECQGYPLNYIAAAILAVIAVRIDNFHLVQVKRNQLKCSILTWHWLVTPKAIKTTRWVLLSSRLLSTTIVWIRSIKSSCRAGTRYAHEQKWNVWKLILMSFRKLLCAAAFLFWILFLKD